MEQYDIVIVGSGIVGLTFANLMAQNLDLKIAMISSDDPGLRKDIGRVCALNHASLRLLGQLQLPACNYSFYDKVFVWKDGAELDFSAKEFGYDNLGAIVNNVELESQLWHNVKDRIETFCNVSADTAQQGYEITLTDRRKIRTKLLIGADGSDSWVRHNLGIKFSSEVYDQHAIVVTLRTAKKHNNTALQKFVPTGTIALLPLKDANTSSLVWSCANKEYGSIMDLSDDEFASLLSKELDYKLGCIELITKRVSFPLRSLHASNYIGTNAAVIGDAAHVVHPLAGQGVNYGILDAIVLAEKLLPADLDSAQGALIDYARSRRGQNGMNIIMLSNLKKIFMEDYSIVSGVLSAGMNIINSSRLAKKKLLAKALGL